MQKPPAQQLFALYHLGLDAQGRYQFRNLHQCAKALGTDVDTLNQWLAQDRLDQDTVSRLAFNVSRWHADAQFVTPEDAPGLVQRAWTAYQEALQQGPGEAFRHDVDYDDLWDESRGNQ